MKFILLLVALPLVSATLSDCEKEFLRSCRQCELPVVPTDKSCPLVGYDCAVDEEELGKFNRSNGLFGRDCDSIRCTDPDATLFVDGVPYKSLACSENLWRFGKHYTLNTTTAACIKRCDKCKTWYNKDVQRSKAAEIIPPVIGTPCAQAACQSGFVLHGVPKDGDKDANDPVEGPIVCKGNGKWQEVNTQKVFERVYCVPDAN